MHNFPLIGEHNFIKTLDARRGGAAAAVALVG